MGATNKIQEIVRKKKETESGDLASEIQDQISLMRTKAQHCTACLLLARHYFTYLEKKKNLTCEMDFKCQGVGNM